MVIQDAVTISQEVQSGTVFGSVRLYHVDDPTKPESSAQRMLALTYPAQALRQALSAIAQRLSGERVQGTSDGWGGPTSSSRTWARGKTRPGGALSAALFASRSTANPIWSTAGRSCASPTCSGTPCSKKT